MNNIFYCHLLDKIFIYLFLFGIAASKVDINLSSTNIGNIPSKTPRMVHYDSLIRQLYRINLANPVKLGLENSHLLYKLFEQPLKNISVIHVAGTNGKGSVSLKIAECLRRGGLRTGLFVSPHISSFRERIQIDGKAIEEETVVVSD